ncbi:inwardly-rectifying potassium channel [Monoraphidium neglectum]|uniref:Inwardly-rectifying potassium channel n=1 Tax=Monoraphidium neglectum TaxID=145388 RepID=A0A0D2LP76_9CHLO|nr:inwardly-rectifying potassium channel [Monoraphidium neglectum]KIY91806.1 inwardly-rectifying potassium channel [Monoraphidium neglectum]|eukprot:XP_013890826.1 inwardly-rectifying potassium channel [Monoraphidium neglectum]
MVAVYGAAFFGWALIYYVTWRWDGTCFVGFSSFQSAVLFSIETMFTIGYGTHAIGDCWLPAALVGAHCLLGLLMESVFIGIVFAKISHPKAGA